MGVRGFCVPSLLSRRGGGAMVSCKLCGKPGDASAGLHCVARGARAVQLERLAMAMQ